MPNGLIKKIEALLEDGGVSQKAAISLVLEAQMMQLRDSDEVKSSVLNLDTEFKEVTKNVMELAKMKETVEKLEKDVGELRDSLDCLVKQQDEYPSLLWLLRYKTTKTLSFILTIVSVIVLLSYVIVSNEGFKEMILKFLGLQ